MSATACAGILSFNPRPPLLAGETPNGVRTLALVVVSIHARHYWRARHGKGPHGGTPEAVSIHARHYWRARLRFAGIDRDDWLVSIHARHYWRARQVMFAS